MQDECRKARCELKVDSLNNTTLHKIQMNVLSEAEHWNADKKQVTYVYRKEITTCSCGRTEYTDCMIEWKGNLYCRVCSYQRFEIETDYAWYRGEEAFEYPIHKDGTDYRKLSNIKRRKA